MGKNIDDEVWIPIRGFEKYEVSNMGKVRCTNYNRKGITKVLKSKLNGKGYPQVWLCVNGKRHTLFVHRLVASHFVPNPNNFPQVNHKNEDKLDNRAENLEWCTCKYNNEYSRGVKISQFSLSGEFLSDFNSFEAIHSKYGFTYRSIRDCCIGLKENFGGYIWRYKTK